MKQQKRQPSPDSLVEKLIEEIQRTGTRCDTVKNFNTLYPNAKPSSTKLSK